MGAAEVEMIVFVTQSQCAPRARRPETKVFACVRKEITPQTSHGIIHMGEVSPSL